MNEEIEEKLHREDVTLATVKKRALAFIIDEVLLSLLLILSFLESFRAAGNTQELILLTNSFVLEYMFLKIVYQAFFVMQYGATLGKLAMKIRVVELRTFDNPNVIVSLNRAIFRVISEMIFYLGFLWGMMNPSQQAWHDLTAKTLVIDV